MVKLVDKVAVLGLTFTLGDEIFQSFSESFVADLNLLSLAFLIPGEREYTLNFFFLICISLGLTFLFNSVCCLGDWQLGLDANNESKFLHESWASLKSSSFPSDFRRFMTGDSNRCLTRDLLFSEPLLNEEDGVTDFSLTESK